jgi:hypothetical protein
MTLYDSVNVTLEPHLLYRVLVGLLNVATCPNCGRRAAIAHPFLYHDVTRRLFAYVHPRAELPDEQRQQVLEQLRRMYGRAVEAIAHLKEPLGQPGQPRRAETPPGRTETSPDAEVGKAGEEARHEPDAPPLQVVFGVEQLCTLINGLLLPEERLGKLALNSTSRQPEERQRFLAIAQQMAQQMGCQVEVEEGADEYTVWLYGSRRAIGTIMRELAPRQ